MKLDLAEINHNYITKVLIFSVFAYKNLFKEKNVFNQAVHSFCLKRIPGLEINLEFPPDNTSETRDSVLDNILYDTEVKTNLVTINYRTGYKSSHLNINLDEEEKYEIFMYS